MDFRLSIPGQRENSYFIEKNREKDSIKVWLTDSTLYSQSQIKTIIDYPFTDSLGILDIKEDTIQMRFWHPGLQEGQKSKRPCFYL